MVIYVVPIYKYLPAPVPQSTLTLYWEVTHASSSSADPPHRSQKPRLDPSSFRILSPLLKHKMEYKTYNGTTTITIQPIPRKSTWVCWNQRSQHALSSPSPNSNPNLISTPVPRRILKSSPSSSTRFADSTNPHLRASTTKLSKLLLAITIFLGATYGEGMTRTIALIALFVVYLTEIG
ncbi:hypothetical protein CVT25_009637 [Psilocybe cyanescens]|uniref:Uncharacterized protein n=1 Tax=Psilocybe cyanescens TaxID=93625 RepID=A0A409XGV9_PSICY|nr:hypothetical protein CVT25_009637 [Psilocybe cyanescens]